MIPAAASRCFPTLLVIALATAPISGWADDPDGWPRWRGPQGDGTWLHAPAIDPDGGDGLEPLWRQTIGGGYSGVTVAGGRVYTMDRQGQTPQVTERVLCFDAQSGEPVWTHSYASDYSGLEYDSGPRASVTIADGKVWTLGTSGHVHCLDAATGRVIWSLDAMARFGAVRPKWGFAASPVIWKDTVIIHLGVPDGGGFVAFGKDDGVERWRGSGDPAGYCTPVFTRHGDRDLMIAWTPAHIQALDPDTGRTLWQFPYEITYGVSIATPIVHDGLVFVAGYWHGSKAIRLADGSLAWEDNTHLRGLMSQPLYRDGVAWLLDKQHGLVSFDWKTGQKIGDDAHRLTPAERNPQVNLVWLGQTPGVLALNANGELIHGTLTRDGFTEAWREQLIGKTWAHPAFAGDRVYARDDRSLVAARLPVAAGAVAP